MGRSRGFPIFNKVGMLEDTVNSLVLYTSKSYKLITRDEERESVRYIGMSVEDLVGASGLVI